ncbi:MAG: HEAT repeat domain-containing protein [Elusimicrobiota bacterium]
MTKQGRAPSRFARTRYYSAAALLAGLLLAASCAFAATTAESIQALSSPDLKVAAAAEAALLEAGDAAVPELAVAMRRGLAQAKTGRVLAKMGRKGMLKLLELCDDPKLGSDAAQVVFWIASPAFRGEIPELLACMNKPALKHQCGRALVKAVDEKAVKAVPLLAAKLLDQDPDIRAYAAAALGQAGPRAKAVVPALRVALGDPSSSVRLGAAVALGKVKARDAETLAALEKAAQDPDSEVRNFAVQALKAGRKSRKT